jgi:hypothetical protein
MVQSCSIRLAAIGAAVMAATGIASVGATDPRWNNIWCVHRSFCVQPNLKLLGWGPGDDGGPAPM